MMVNSISGVRFCAQADTAATGTKKVDADYLNRPGAFTKPEADTVVKTQTEPKKKSGLGKKLWVLAGVALAVGAALVAGNETGLVRVLDEAAKSENIHTNLLFLYLLKKRNCLYKSILKRVTFKVTLFCWRFGGQRGIMVLLICLLFSV